jgi:hypothetical protein
LEDNSKMMLIGKPLLPSKHKVHKLLVPVRLVAAEII